MVLIPNITFYLFKTDIVDIHYLIHSFFLIAQDDKPPLVVESLNIMLNNDLKNCHIHQVCLKSNVHLTYQL